MNSKDYYKILNIPRNATSKQIKTAFRKLARKLHPDVNKEPDAEVRFKQINEAYEVLYDPEKRKNYDSITPEKKDSNNYNYKTSNSNRESTNQNEKQYYNKESRSFENDEYLYGTFFKNFENYKKYDFAFYEDIDELGSFIGVILLVESILLSGIFYRGPSVCILPQINLMLGLALVIPLGWVDSHWGTNFREKRVNLLEFSYMFLLMILMLSTVFSIPAVYHSIYVAAH